MPFYVCKPSHKETTSSSNDITVCTNQTYLSKMAPTPALGVLSRWSSEASRTPSFEAIDRWEKEAMRSSFHPDKHNGMTTLVSNGIGNNVVLPVKLNSQWNVSKMTESISSPILYKATRTITKGL